MARILGSDPWTCTSLPTIGGDKKGIGENLQGKWVIELGELGAFSKARIQHIKDFISTRVDTYRPAYGRSSKATDFPRTCVFLGSTNEQQFLNDPTGDRRSWVVEVGKYDKVALEIDRDQLWAEAVHLFNDGVQYWPTPEQEAAMMEDQETFVVKLRWLDEISEWLLSTGYCPTTSQILTEGLHIEPKDYSDADIRQVATVMQKLGMRSVQVKIPGAGGARHSQWRKNEV